MIPKSGSFKLINNFDAARKLIKEGSEKNVLSALAKWHKSLMKVLSGTRSGRVSRVPMTKKKYTASAPGEAPAVATGTLKTTYKFKMETTLPPMGIIGSPQKYAPMLEYGTSRMKPRPHLKKAYDEKKKEILEALGKKVV